MFWPSRHMAQGLSSEAAARLSERYGPLFRVEQLDSSDPIWLERLKRTIRAFNAGFDVVVD